MSDPTDKPSQAEGEDIDAAPAADAAGGDYDPEDRPSQAEGEDDASAEQ